ncbi:hypothetical protein FA15DRAFT_756737 [Coprinopsis marcescibilis]|uniref:BTB domain-containing protein n=1 Tax=Coprinopsis marcescibilis TaxID=230819 RepID=A0A5C3KVF8_COPMA|nr:hypothetical protein FA15DRAFT_756737 [Coprinopsis marcescibilis]
MADTPSSHIQEASTCPKFSASEAEIVFQSNDNVRFRIHSANLSVNAGGFPPVASVSGDGGLTVAEDECVPLSEPSKVLEIIFAFVYPQRYPDIETFEEFDFVSEISEASEKYQIYPAMNICRRRLRDFAKSHPIQVCLYGARHGYDDLVELTARHAFVLPLSTIIPLLPPHLILPWINYHHKWLQVRNSFFAINYHDYPQGRHSLTTQDINCMDISYTRNKPAHGSCGKFINAVVPLLAKAMPSPTDEYGLEFLLDLDKTFDVAQLCSSCTHTGSCCRKAVDHWKYEVQQKISKIPAFKDFIATHV